MDKQIKTVNFNADTGLLDRVNEHLEKLPRLLEQITKVEVFLKLENVSHQIKDKIAEIKVSVPQHTFFVKESSKSFEKSFNAAFETLISQIRRQKSKLLQKQ